ncbi:hypothetical protein Lesp02_33410 [Lentzea sp. NBRC 105346]|uniref:hypothetical protein n=1 Tax=Lentzea sp. NBRC 105346 TaxID=3032205 RepID=UPI0024A4671C|nr:hypothetical protein [Lentzea sp. NBRC 105346]GLZ31153.1 hypothetical protein Lesp02_33410 [Lentzea sp. NBRC 105346]
MNLTKHDFAAMRRWLKDNPGTNFRDCVDALDLSETLAWRPIVPPPRVELPPPKYCDACGMAIAESGVCRC